MKYTKNLNLKKPEQDDFYNVENDNDNMDKIDAELAKKGDMLKNVYDTDKSGVVDNSERLGGEEPDYYTNISNLKQPGGYVIFNCGSATEVI